MPNSVSKISNDNGFYTGSTSHLALIRRLIGAHPITGNAISKIVYTFTEPETN